MDLLPNESGVIEAIPQLLAEEFDCARRLLAFGAGLPTMKDDLHSGNLRHDTVISTLALYTKAATSFRAAIHLCAIGGDRNVLPISRSMFETTLNLAFLTRRQVSLYQFNESKTTPRTAVNLHGRTLTTGFRTDLYNAWCILMDEKNVRGYSRTPGLKRAGNRIQKQLDDLERPYVDAIGPEWEKQIKGKTTCVGLTIENFAASMGGKFRSWYALVYANDSKHVHQSDMTQYLDHDPVKGTFLPRWFTSPKEIRSTLHKAAWIFLFSVEELNKRFRFSDTSGATICRFAEELQSWNLDDDLTTIA